MHIDRSFGFNFRLLPATKVIMITTLVVFMLQFFTKDLAGVGGVGPFTSVFGLSSGVFLKGFVWQPLTYAFLHAGGRHLFWNMLLFFFFASSVEEVMGRRRFLLFYLGCGAVAGVCWYLLGLVTGGSSVLVGASGAVYGVVCAMAAMFPNQVVLLFFVIRVPLKYLVLVMMLMQFAFTFDGSPDSDAVAHSAHLFGGLAGYLYGVRMRKHAFLGLSVDDTWGSANPISDWVASRKRGKFRVVREEGVSRKPSEQEVDSLLEKIHRDGYESLSASERELLDNASSSRPRK